MLELLKSKTGRTLIELHRGVEGDVPENSWSAIGSVTNWARTLSKWMFK